MKSDRIVNLQESEHDGWSPWLDNILYSKRAGEDEARSNASKETPMFIMDKFFGKAFVDFDKQDVSIPNEVSIVEFFNIPQSSKEKWMLSKIYVCFILIERIIWKNQNGNWIIPMQSIEETIQINT